VQTAVAVGADQAEFEACYDGAEGTAKVLELDDLRRQRGIYSQPTFDINGTIQGGAPRFEIFAAVLDDAYNVATP
jgi:2-hydroxychromene-2-carboxylate isomerase